MCNNHNFVRASEAVRSLTEAREDAYVCEHRIKFLEKQVLEFQQYLNQQGKDGKSIVLAIREAHLMAINEDWNDEFIWSRGKEDPKLWDMMDGVDDDGYRFDDEHDQYTAYWGMLHNIARKAFMKSVNEPNSRGTQIFEIAQDLLDKVEEEYDASSQRPIPYNYYKLLQKMRKRINFRRFKMYQLTYEQWAYLCNRLNFLMSTKDGKTGEIKQYPCKMQNVMTDDLHLNDEDVEYEVVQSWYTRD